MRSHRVFESHEAVAHPPSGGPVPADVGEGLVIVTIRSAERNLLYGLVHYEVLRETERREDEHRSIDRSGDSIKSHLTRLRRLFTDDRDRK